MWQPLGCPRCPTPLEESHDGWVCPDHGVVPLLRRPVESTYDDFAAHLLVAGGFPTYLPWPMSPGWRVSDFAVVAGPMVAVGTLCCCSGTSDGDGPVDLMVAAEEPGTGLGGRYAGLLGADPGPEVGRGPASARVRVEGRPVALWSVSTSTVDADFDRSVFVGEAFGRWLWLVLRPASAMLLLREEWTMQDASSIGPALVEIEFGGPGPVW
jgi:hypothetical protein